MEVFLQQTFERLLDKTDLKFKRYLYERFQPGRLTGLIGPRGVGKTTLMLQYIKEHVSQQSKVFYFSADSVYFHQTSLLEFVNNLYNLEGYRFFFIDEVHKYNNWTQELKNLYDAFPDIKIVYSGSSSLEITKGSYDLSRRASLYHLSGMSFREYFNFKYDHKLDSVDLSQLLAHPKQFNRLGGLEAVLGRFKAYLAEGYYPFQFEDPHTYYQRVLRVVEKIIFEDIPSYFELKTQNLHLFQKVLSYLASVPPGTVNTANIAKNMNVAHQTIAHYLNILSDVGLIQMVYPYEGGNQLLRKPQKIFLHNTTLLYAVQQFVGEPVDKGSLRELYFVQALRDAQHAVYYSKQADYRTKTHIFEIGGKNKTAKQIAGLDTPAYLVKDDVVIATANTVPLLYFGFLY